MPIITEKFILERVLLTASMREDDLRNSAYYCDRGKSFDY